MDTPMANSQPNDFRDRMQCGCVTADRLIAASAVFSSAVGQR
jgi:hypothetical protein